MSVNSALKSALLLAVIHWGQLFQTKWIVHRNVTSSCDSTQHHWASYPSRTAPLFSTVSVFLVLSWDSSSLFISPGVFWRGNMSSTFTSLPPLLDLRRALLMVSPPELVPCNAVSFDFSGCDWGETSLKELLAGPDDAQLKVTRWWGLTSVCVTKFESSLSFSSWKSLESSSVKPWLWPISSLWGNSRS